MRAHYIVVWILLAAALAGCKQDECLGGPPQAQIDVQLSGVAVADVSSVEVTLTINGGKPLTRAFSPATPSFVFEFGDQDRAPRSLVIKAVAHGAAGIVGTGQTSVTFTSDACNFFSVVVKPGGAADGGADAEPLDGGPDSKQNDGPVVTPDGAADSGPDSMPPDTISPELGVVLTQGGISTAGAGAGSGVLLLEGSFEAGETLCSTTHNMCITGGIAP